MASSAHYLVLVNSLLEDYFTRLVKTQLVDLKKIKLNQTRKIKKSFFLNREHLSNTGMRQLFLLAVTSAYVTTIIIKL